jgi:iron(III) transport system substrate-binding protein
MRHPKEARKRLGLVIALTSSALVLSACGASTGNGSDPAAEAEAAAAAVYEEFAGLSGAEREEALVAAAQEEGSVTLYTTNSNVDDLVDGFEDKYGITVETYRAGSDAMIQRLLQEQAAGFYGADVVEDADAAIIAREGLAAEYVNPELTDQIADFETAGGIVPTRKSVFVVSWNTDLVDASEIPEKLEDFADPKWEGRLSMESGDWAWYMAVTKLWEEEGKSAEEIEEIWAGIVANSSVANGHTFQGELLGAGQFDVALSLYTRTVDRDADDGVPIAYRRADNSVVGPTVYLYDGALPLKRAPHPAAALLLIDYMLNEGQQLLAEAGWPTAIPQDGRLDGIELNQVSIEDYFDEGPQWQDEYEEVIAGREVVG